MLNLTKIGSMSQHQGKRLCLFIYWGTCQIAASFKSFVVFIPQEGLEWLDWYDITYSFVICSLQTPANPSFGTTMTKTSKTHFCGMWLFWFLFGSSQTQFYDPQCSRIGLHKITCKPWYPNMVFHSLLSMSRLLSKNVMILWWSSLSYFWVESFMMLSVTKPAKSAYLVNRGYANFQKMVWMRIICIPRLIISQNFWCLILNLRTCTIVIRTIFGKFINLWLTSPSGPVRYIILRANYNLRIPRSLQ